MSSVSGTMSREDAFDRSGAFWGFVAIGMVIPASTHLTGEEKVFAIFAVAILAACAMVAVATVLYCTVFSATLAVCHVFRREPPKMFMMHWWDEKAPFGLKDTLAVAALATIAFALGMLIGFALFMF